MAAEKERGEKEKRDWGECQGGKEEKEEEEEEGET